MMDHTTKKVVVVGVGNLLMGDDGIGIHVVQELKKRKYPQNLEAYDAMVNAFLALEYLDNKDLGIIVDAYQGGKEPGTLFEVSLNPGDLDTYTDEFNLSLHDLNFLDALKSGQEAYHLPEEIILIGVEPSVLEPRMELSPCLMEAVPKVIKRIEEILDFKECA
ncbi:hydrogenase 2 maturation protease [archaeon BMS3Abin16]|nr:hydrogenase 2 maturation protease [archaeon BMS3Abin16]